MNNLLTIMRDTMTSANRRSVWRFSPQNTWAKESKPRSFWATCSVSYGEDESSKSNKITQSIALSAISRDDDDDYDDDVDDATGVL